MGELGVLLTGILDVGLAPVLVILLLWKGFEFINKFTREIYELRIGIEILINKFDATEEYKQAMQQLKEREKA